MPQERTCPICKKVFLPDPHRRKYCCDACANAGRRIRDNQYKEKNREKIRENGTTMKLSRWLFPKTVSMSVSTPSITTSSSSRRLPPGFACSTRWQQERHYLYRRGERGEVRMNGCYFVEGG